MPDRQSKQHKAVVAALKDICDVAYEEEYNVKWNGKTYLVDIYIPRYLTAFEIQGSQHLEYNSFMHSGHKGNFIKQQKRDVEKVEACEAAGIKLIYIYPKDKVTSDFLMDLIIGEDDERIATKVSS